jgi:hypothetical protein
MVGGSCGMLPGWQPKRLQLGVLQPKLTNALMLVFAYHMPNIVQRGNGQRRPKLCLGLCALSSNSFDSEVGVALIFSIIFFLRFSSCVANPVLMDRIRIRPPRTGQIRT